jgi:hypothetical protein
MDGFDAPQTPAELDRIGVLKVGPRSAENVLVLNAGTGLGSAFFRPLARMVTRQTPGWQVWAVERRENLLEDQSVIDEAKAGEATATRLFEYYLGFLTDPTITDHFTPIPDSSVNFAREWGMRVAVEDLRKAVRAASRRGGEVVVGGHSLGGWMTTAYARWDFNGRPGARGLAGLVYIDGVANPDQVTAGEAEEAVAEIDAGSPWADYGGIPTPFTGLFSVTGSTATHIAPNELDPFREWPLSPVDLRPPVSVTHEAQWGFALDVKTSPSYLIGAQAHLGHLAETGDPRPWVDDGLTPVQRYADMYSGTGLSGLDGTSWYQPARMLLDSRAIAAGEADPAAQDVLGLRATHGDDLGRGLRIFAFAAGGGADGGELANAKAVAEQSRIPRRNLTLVDRKATYTHVEALSAYPRNAFASKLGRFLRRLGR